MSEDVDVLENRAGTREESRLQPLSDVPEPLDAPGPTHCERVAETAMARLDLATDLPSGTKRTLDDGPPRFVRNYWRPSAARTS